MILIVTALAVLAIAATLVLTALKDTIVFFHTPSEVQAQTVKPGQRIRLGGLVEEGSVKRPGGATVEFKITDLEASLPVTFTGILPDLFREGQGVVAEGRMNASGTFVADTVLAKHDETYMPREVAEKLKKKGWWQPEKKIPGAK